MKFKPKLESVIIHKRYKRFLADVLHPSLGEITVHCPNTGSMKNCWESGWEIWLQKSDNAKRKYPFTWVLSKNPSNEFIGINTITANRLVEEGIREGKVKQLAKISKVDREVKYGEENSKIDLLITHKDDSLTYIEVKSVTLKEKDGWGYFPDAVTTRGQKHIRELMSCIDNGHEAVLFFMVQHSGIERMTIASNIDPEYFKLLQRAINHGVKVIAYRAGISDKEIILDHQIEFVLDRDN